MQKHFNKLTLEIVVLFSGLFVVGSSYVLSFFNAFSQVYLSMVAVILCFFWMGFIYSKFPKVKYSSISFRRHITLCVFGIFALLTFFQGFLSRPTTTDAHNYHIARAMYWMADRTVLQDQVYTSHDFMGPFPSMLNAVLYSTLDADTLLFFGQWISFVLCFFLVGRLADSLSATPTQRKIAQLLFLAIPIVVLEASSTQADLLVTVWSLLTVLFALRYRYQAKSHTLIFLCLAVGLGILTKATMYIYAIIPFIIVVWSFYHSKEKVKSVLFGSAGILCLVSLLLPMVLQNKRLFDSYLGDSYKIEGGKIPFTVTEYTIGGAILNVYRNIVMNVPFLVFAPQIDRIVEPVFISLGTSFSDRRYAWFEQKFEHLSFPIPQEDIAPAPIQVVLILTATAFVWKRKGKKELAVLFYASVLSFVVFSVVLLWQEYHVRQHISLMVIFLPVVALVIPFSQYIWKIIVALSVSSAFVVLLANTSRPLISYEHIFPYISSYAPTGFSPPESVLYGRTDQQLFLSRPYWYTPYTETIALLRQNNIRVVRLRVDEGYIYPFIALAKDKGIVVVSNATTPVEAEVFAGLREKYQFAPADSCIAVQGQRQIMCVRFAVPTIQKISSL